MKKYIFLFTLILISCGVKKSHVETTVIKKDSVVESKVEVVVDQTKYIKDSTNIKVDVEDNEVSIIPIDSSKEIIVDGKTYKNVIIKRSKKKITSSYNNNKTELNNKHVDSSSTNKASKKESKDVKRSQDYLSYFWLILLLIILLYSLWRNKHRLFNVL
jgi:maltodextrin utilization protein YvdJ